MERVLLFHTFRTCAILCWLSPDGGPVSYPKPNPIAIARRLGAEKENQNEGPRGGEASQQGVQQVP